MTTEFADFPAANWDGFSQNSQRVSMMDDLAPNAADYAKIIKEVIATQVYITDNVGNSGIQALLANGSVASTVKQKMKAVYEDQNDATDEATITFDLDLSNTHRVTMTDDRTLALSNPDGAQRFSIRLTQDGTGSRLATWFATIKWAGGSAPTLTTTAAKSDLFEFIRTGTDTYDGFILGQNI